ncbi:MAG TPA: glycosyltransferase family 4 protein [Candidatus Paceibacterota bacterium]
MKGKKARLLVITQKVDRDDPVLGFFDEWLRSFEPLFDEINVICLFRGKSVLGSKTKIWSLGKERKTSRIRYLWLFYRYVFKLRNSYDAVFVHMNVEYVLLAGLWWRWTGKKIILWYNHTSGGWKTRLAFHIAHVLCHTSPYAASAGKIKSQRMPAGINTAIFKEQSLPRREHSILFIGRIAPIKKVHVLVDALLILYKKNIPFFTAIYGDALPSTLYYVEQLKAKAHALTKEGKLSFFSAIKNRETPSIYNSYEIFVNLTPRGNFDKTVLEALACGTTVLASSDAFYEVLEEPYRFIEDDPEELARKIEHVFRTPRNKETRERHSAYVKKEHELSYLGLRLRKLIQ